MEAVLQIIIRVLFFAILGWVVGGFVYRKIHPYRNNYNKLAGVSYSQIGIYVDGKKYLPLDECIVTFERKTGWTTWDRDTKEPIGSERQGNICITVDGVAVIGKLPKEKEE